MTFCMLTLFRDIIDILVQKHFRFRNQFFFLLFKTFHSSRFRDFLLLNAILILKIHSLQEVHHHYSVCVCTFERLYMQYVCVHEFVSLYVNFHDNISISLVLVLVYLRKSNIHGWMSTHINICIAARTRMQE